MDIQIQTPDSLDIILVKSHLYVDFNDDDTLIQHYIDASLTASEIYLNRGVLYTSYQNTSAELDNREIINGVEYYVLRIKWRPQDVFIQFDGGSFKHLFKDEFTYDIGNSKLYIPAIYDDEPNAIVNIDATYGIENNEIPSLDQARMLMVGDWYAFREANSNLNLKEFSTSAKFLLDSLEGAIW